MLLSLKNLNKSFGKLKVTRDINLNIEQGDILGIIGPNGAGKSTLFNLITGNLAPSSGDVFFNDENISNLPAFKRARLGIGRSFQIPQPFESMTVAENIKAAFIYGAQKDSTAADSLAIELLTLTSLDKLANYKAESLTLLQRKRLEMARAMATKPSLLLLDEVGGGLTEAECQQLIQTVKDIAKTGVTVVWIEHIVHALLAVVNRLIVINEGALVADGEPNETINSTLVQRLYLGEVT
ncbi:ABC transporter ATP-binding protein [Alteromonas sp. P256]|uniref:ABC transporter ATP-binding protein n=1 Tax=Alteromonas sp. P256 TaxID=3117399 RepID=UPI002FE03C72